jgi:hypothetical protein
VSGRCARCTARGRTAGAHAGERCLSSGGAPSAHRPSSNPRALLALANLDKARPLHTGASPAAHSVGGGPLAALPYTSGVRTLRLVPGTLRHQLTAGSWGYSATHPSGPSLHIVPTPPAFSLLLRRDWPLAFAYRAFRLLPARQECATLLLLSPGLPAAHLRQSILASPPWSSVRPVRGNCLLPGRHTKDFVLFCHLGECS